MPSRILLISPHADDELIGAGGSLLRWKAEGCEILLVLVASSDIGHRHLTAETPKSVRENEFRRASEILSTEAPRLLGMTDSKLDCAPLQTLVAELDAVLESWRPDTILYPEPSYHQDHQFVNRACTAALRPTKTCLPRKILTYEIPTSTWVGSGPMFKPNFYVDISNELDTKLKVFGEVYKSQFTETERCKLAAKGIRDHAVYRGMECGLQAAEAFRLLQERV